MVKFVETKLPTYLLNLTIIKLHILIKLPKKKKTFKPKKQKPQAYGSLGS